MKKFVSRLQTLSEQAARFQSAVNQAPTRIAEFRETIGDTAAELRKTVDVTGDELQGLRSEVEENLVGLRVDGDERLLDSLRMLDAATPVFREAGYEIGGTDIELSPNQRLVVHLSRVDDVPEKTLHHLVVASMDSRLVHSVLKALVQAEAMADRIDLDGQVYHKLMVAIGPVPVVRMCWCPDPSGSGWDSASTSGGKVYQSAEAARNTESLESDLLAGYSESSIFGTPKKIELSRPKPTRNPLLRDEPEEKAEKSGPTVPPPLPLRRKEWSSAALNKFKQMPR